MCGICGQYNFMDRRPVEPRRIAAMSDAIVHRGPDDDGAYFSEGVGLGFRRLSIIDLAGGHQPMSDAEANPNTNKPKKHIKMKGRQKK